MEADKVVWQSIPVGPTETKLQGWEATGLSCDGDLCMGVDPGRNFGISYYLPHIGALIALSGRLPAGDYLEETRKFVRWYDNLDPRPCPVMLEGASYGDKYGQVMLEGIRTAFELTFKDLGYPVTRIAPTAARKAVFGSGKISGKTIWKGKLNGNAADAAVLALAAGGYRFESKS